MISDVFDDNALVRIIDHLLDSPNSDQIFTQKEICKRMDISRPTAVHAFKILKRNGMIKKVRNGYKTIWNEKSPMKSLLQFDMRICFYQAEKKR